MTTAFSTSLSGKDIEHMTSDAKQYTGSDRTCHDLVAGANEVESVCSNSFSVISLWKVGDITKPEQGRGHSHLPQKK